MAESKKDKIIQYQGEFSNWLDKLSSYHERFNANYEKYTANQSIKGTVSKINDPVASELVERVIQKLFERDPKFFVESRGKNIPKEVKNVISNTAAYLWDNPDTVQASGPMKNKLKVLGREFCVTGNGVVEAFWNHKSDAPDFRVVPVEDVVFDPTKTLKSSQVYYVRQFVSVKYLEDNVEIKKDGEVVTGMFKSAAIKKLKRWLDGNESQTKQDPTTNQINRSGGTYEKDVERFQLISRYEGDKVCRFITDDDMEEPVLIQEYTNEVLGTHPLSAAMDMEVVKEPYSRSFLDDLKGMFTLKNLFLSQLSDYGSKVLNPPTIVNPNIGAVNLRTVANMYKLGGIVVADPSMIDQKPISPIGNFGMDMLNWIEGRAESVSGIGAYLAGVPNQTSDKTQGTKGGIEALVQQSVSPVRDRQINIEESIIEPVVNKWLKMVAATMSEDEFKWVLITGEDSKWIKVTKGLLSGKIKLIDLMQAELIEDPEIQEIVNMMMEEGKDPETDTVFDVDWFVKVETGSLAEQDSTKEIEGKRMALETGLQMGLPVDAEKLWKEIAQAAGIKEPDQYLKKEMQDGGINPVTGEVGQPNPAAQPIGPNGAIPTMAGPGGNTGNPAVGTRPF